MMPQCTTSLVSQIFSTRKNLVESWSGYVGGGRGRGGGVRGPETGLAGVRP